MISEIEVGFNGVTQVLVKDVNCGVTSKGAPYLSMIIQDKSGEMEAKFWSVKEEDISKIYAGGIYDIQGDVISYNKSLQFRIQKMDSVLTEVDLTQFCKSSKYSKDELKTMLFEYINSIKNKKIKAIVNELFIEYQHDILIHPAAKTIHHDYVGGLATHIIGMCKIGGFITEMYPLLNRDLVIAGIMLHDLGKLIELSGSVVCEYTIEGKLLGHISIMQAIVYEKAKNLKLEGEEIILLRHMILSHHGSYEYGSPVLPMIPEAEILTYIDNIDARMSTLEKAMDNITEGEFTKRLFSLEKRSFYKMKEHE